MRAEHDFSWYLLSVGVAGIGFALLLDFNWQLTLGLTLIWFGKEMLKADTNDK